MPVSLPQDFSRSSTLQQRGMLWHVDLLIAFMNCWREDTSHNRKFTSKNLETGYCFCVLLCFQISSCSSHKRSGSRPVPVASKQKWSWLGQALEIADQTCIINSWSLSQISTHGRVHMGPCLMHVIHHDTSPNGLWTYADLYAVMGPKSCVDFECWRIQCLSRAPTLFWYVHPCKNEVMVVII